MLTFSLSVFMCVCLRISMVCIIFFWTINQRLVCRYTIGTVLIRENLMSVLNLAGPLVPLQLLNVHACTLLILLFLINYGRYLHG